ncbi:VOC family protein [Saccharopolyspora gloriosae]|uniref:VOC family protein n=1 Tax=Saccharopolyspora gloriosae TaxID=455344 RepID=UPI001FB81C68|nr:VOC family protein [Saccharopolyspora gloriosae]
MNGTGFTVEFATARPMRLARWWAQVLDWTVDTGSPEPVVRPAGPPGVPLLFTAASREKTGKNGVHLDLRSESHEHERTMLLRLFNAGARFADVGQGEDVPWVVMTDPDGNELCLLEPRKSDVDTGAVHSVVVDSADPALDAQRWTETTPLIAVHREPHLVALHAPDRTGPYLEFLNAHGPGTKLRVRPQGTEQPE